jgi:hypothetical protein
MHCEASGRKEFRRRWGIYEQDKTGDQQDLFAGGWDTENREQGIAMAELLAESELIREFAGRMDWETFPLTAPANQRYRFIKEE